MVLYVLPLLVLYKRSLTSRFLFFVNRRGEVFVFSAKQWDSDPKKVTVIGNQRVESIQVYNSASLCAITADGAALLLEPAQGSENLHLAEQYAISERLVAGDNEKIVCVQVVAGCVAVLTNTGSLMTRGTSNFVLGHATSNQFQYPQGLETGAVVSMSFSDEHALAIDKEGNTYAWS